VGATELFQDKGQLSDHDALLIQQLVHCPSWVVFLSKSVLKAGRRCCRIGMYGESLSCHGMHSRQTDPTPLSTQFLSSECSTVLPSGGKMRWAW